MPIKLEITTEKEFRDRAELDLWLETHKLNYSQGTGIMAYVTRDRSRLLDGCTMLIRRITAIIPEPVEEVLYTYTPS